MEELKTFDKIEDQYEKKRVLKYFILLYPNYDELSFDEQWYAEISKDYLTTYLDDMDTKIKRFKESRPELSRDDCAWLAYSEILTEHYCNLLSTNTSEDTYYFVFNNINEVNRRYLDKKELMDVQYIPVDSSYLVASVIAEIKKESKQKTISGDLWRKENKS